jgi:hypothetical protein
MNFKQQIINALNANGETEADIQCFVVENGKISDWDDSDSDSRDIPEDKVNMPLSWANNNQLLDYETDDDYGSLDCHYVLIYTLNNIYYIHEYDGSHCVANLPRNPK